MSDPEFRVLETGDVLLRSSLPETLGKYFALSVAVVYATGIVIVSASLARYGIANAELVRSEYLGSGLLYWFMLLAAVASLATARYGTRDGLRAWKSGHRLWAILNFLLVLISFYTVPSALTLLSRFEFDVFSANGLWAVASPYIALNALHLIWKLFRTVDLGEDRGSGRSFWTFSAANSASIVGFVVNLALAIGTFSFYAYPAIPPSLAEERDQQFGFR